MDAFRGEGELGNCKDRDEVRAMFACNLAGEVDIVK